MRRRLRMPSTLRDSINYRVAPSRLASGCNAGWHGRREPFPGARREEASRGRSFRFLLSSGIFIRCRYFRSAAASSGARISRLKLSFRRQQGGFTPMPSITAACMRLGVIISVLYILRPIYRTEITSPRVVDEQDGGGARSYALSSRQYRAVSIQGYRGSDRDEMQIFREHHSKIISRQYSRLQRTCGGVLWDFFSVWRGGLKRAHNLRACMTGSGISIAGFDYIL